jgi:hypothetical protein
MSNPKKNRTKRGGTTAIAKAIQDKTGLGRSQSFKLASEVNEIGKVKDIAEAKLLKVKLECQRIARQLEVEEGKYVTRDSVREQGIALGAVVAACLDALVSTLPGQLEGLAAPVMAPIIEKEVQKARDAIADACRGL